MAKSFAQTKFENIINKAIDNGQLQQIVDDKQELSIEEVAQFILDEFSKIESEINTPENFDLILDNLSVATCKAIGG